MIEKIRGIKINGRCFEKEANLKFFPGTNDRISLVYGKNGSGKSTISDAFMHIAINDFPNDFSASLIDESGRVIPSTGSDSVFVFNEKYIDENVKIDADGLGSIVLLGNQVDLQSEIERYTRLQQELNMNYSKAQADYELFDQKTNPISPEYHFERIKRTLQSGWAVDDAKIRGNKINSKVTDGVIKEICGLSVSDTATKLKRQFDETSALLEKVSDTTVSYPQQIPTIHLDSTYEKKLCELLSQSIERPVLSERETLILSVIQNGKQHFVESAQEDFSKPETSVCPYCFRPIDDEYKNSLITNINRVLNKDVDNHRDQLQAWEFPEFSGDYSCYNDLDATLVEKIINQAKVCANIVTKYKNAISTKENNIYTPLHIEVLGLQNSVTQLNMLLSQLEEKRQEFVDAVQKRQNLVQHLISLNKQIAHLQIKQMYLDYQKQIQAKEEAKNKVLAEEGKYNEVVLHLKQLEQDKANAGLAITNINNALDYVFFKHGRLSIELKGTKYYLKSSGKDVKPKDISLGERNIIGLCYFFTQILSNQDIGKLYQREELIVIDDPVSSFDYENKVGIISYIRYQVNRVIWGNTKSKVLILSHDLSTVFDLKKALDDICNSKKRNASFLKTSYSSLELYDRELRQFNKSRSEYAELLKRVYQFADAENPSDNIAIGNIMRRTLEVFATFFYREGVTNIMSTPTIIEALGDHSAYFENLMCRLVLHGESHFEEQVYNLHDDTNFYEFISDGEKQRTARDILCFIYLLNPLHIKAYFRESTAAFEKISNWAKNIPDNGAFEVVSKRTIPLFDFPISAGVGNEILDNAVLSETFETDEVNCDFALRVSGDSMEPNIPDESTILVKKSDDIAEGEIGAFYLNGAVYCKRLTYKNGKVFLCSDNPKYKPIEVHEEDRLTPYGRIVQVVV